MHWEELTKGKIVAQDERIDAIRKNIKEAMEVGKDEPYLGESIHRLGLYETDTELSDRISNKLCRYCYYLDSRIVMDAFTEYQCVKCKKKQLHHNSGVPLFCGQCSEGLSCCKMCGNHLSK